ncbi:glycosyltransferase family 25 protein [Limnohabitans sp. DM1]|uniref:glycosyltransferase family 25 protein n=1 Tax=Limnohabitans sp. DM1 TaxID=1597955 RepID=UPI000AED89FA|nr:glycosyltransferase family 25 protein [Limnohabitans sp. DM1]
MTLHPSFICFVVNLDRSPERLARISVQLQQANIEFCRFAAVDGSKIDWRSPNMLDIQSYHRHHGKEPTAGEVGCFASHVGLMRTFLEGPHAYCLVLEDDAIVPTDFLSLVEALIVSPACGDMTMLYGNRPGLAVKTARLGDGKHDVVGYFGKQTGTVAYLINRKAARAYVDNLLPMRLPIDHAFGQPWVFGIRMRGVRPFPIQTGQFQSDIGQTGHKFKWHRRIATYRSRFATVFRRIVHHIWRDPIWAKSHKAHSTSK